MAAQARNNPNSRFGRDKKKTGNKPVNRSENRSDSRRPDDRPNRENETRKTGTGERGRSRSEGENKSGRDAAFGRAGGNKPGRTERSERKPGQRDNSGKFRSTDRDRRENEKEQSGSGERKSYRNERENKPSFENKRPGRPASSGRDSDSKQGRNDRRERKPGQRDNSGKFRSTDRDRRENEKEQSGSGERKSYRNERDNRPSFENKRPGRPPSSGRNSDTRPGRPDRRERQTGERDNSGKFRTDDRERRGKRSNESEKPSFRTIKRPEKSSTPPQFLRLNKYIANSGICARREADELIAGGYVTVNGEKVTEMGIKVAYSDQVKVRGRLIMPEKKVYVLLNKPKDYITTLDDPYAKKTVVQLVREACPERIYPVGRLDKNTTGVLLFTNDGDLAKKLTHPSSNVPKVYQIQLDIPLTRNHLQEIAAGFTLDDGPIKVDEISFFDEMDLSQVGVQLHSGRNRIVRRIFEHFGYKVKKLDRVFFAGLTKQKLSRGKWRFLTDKEISRLKMNIFE